MDREGADADGPRHHGENIGVCGMVDSSQLMTGVDKVKDFDQLMKGYDSSLNKTSPLMTRFERAKVLGLRTEQLVRGSEPMIPLSDEELTHLSPGQVAERELYERKTPFVIIRNLPDGSQETWRVKDMIIV